VDEDELAAELEELEQEQLDEKLAGAAPVPITSPGASLREPGTVDITSSRNVNSVEY
jgi:hypothetical protein